MKKKNKFITFILSVVPGLGHIYLGYGTRGAMFFSAEILALAAGMFFERYWYFDNQILLVLFLIVWLGAVIDSMILVDKTNVYSASGGNNSEDSITDYSKMEKQNKKMIAMFLSVIPGTGHMYLGLQRQGIELMLGFFLTFFIANWLKVSFFLILAPVIWFYSLFDVMHKVSGDKPMVDEDLLNSDWFKYDDSGNFGLSVFRNRDKVIGYVLIILSVILIFNRVVFPIIDKNLGNEVKLNIQTGILAVLFLAVGIKLLMGTKQSEKKPE